jgi:hypothetical protein
MRTNIEINQELIEENEDYCHNNEKRGGSSCP